MKNKQESLLKQLDRYERLVKRKQEITNRSSMKPRRQQQIDSLNNKKQQKNGPEVYKRMFPKKIYPPTSMNQQVKDTTLPYLNSLQKLLTKEIIDIDISLQKSHKNHIHYQNGYLFKEEPSEPNKLLIKQLKIVLQQNSDSIVYGFRIYKIISDGENLEVVKGKIGKKNQSIQKKLMDRSIGNIEKYQKEKHKYYLKKYKQDWEPFAKRNQKLLTPLFSFKNKLSKDSALKSEEQNNHETLHLKHKKSHTEASADYSQANPSHYLSIFEKEKSRTPKNNSQMSKPSNKNLTKAKEKPSRNLYHDEIYEEELYKMLKKEEKVITIWLPPASYPQFYGLFSFEIYEDQKEQNKLACLLQKYYFFKHSISKRFFNCILEWCNYFIGRYVQSLELIVDKSSYQNYFQNFGWKIKTWIRENLFKISYSRNIL